MTSSYIKGRNPYLVGPQGSVGSGGTQGNQGPASSNTIANAYNVGAGAGDQTFTLSDAKGGCVIFDATSGGFTGTNGLQILGTSSSSVNFPRVGGFQLVHNLTVAVPASDTAWNAINLQSSTLTLTAGGVA